MRSPRPTSSSASRARFRPSSLLILRVERGQFDIFQRGGAGKQVESLKDETDLAIADGRQFLLGQFRDGDTFQQVAAAGGLVQAAQNIHESGFAAAAGAHDGHELAALDANIDAAQRVHLGFAQIVVFVHVINLDEVRASRFRRAGSPRIVGWLPLSEAVVVSRSRQPGLR